MNWLDLILMIILLLSVLSSFRKGFSRELIGLVAVVLALFLGIWFYSTAGSILLPYVSSRSAANFAGFIVVFCAVLLLGSLVSYTVGKFLRVTGLSIFDHALGAAFGIIRGTLIGVALIMGIMAFSPGDHPPDSVVKSRTAPYVVDAARVIVAMAPHQLRDDYRKTYTQVKTAWHHALDKGMRGVSGTEKGEHEREI